tara:strand:+ start:3298 stop:4593 length:1296 start_codon:yes stop_codon:yes gene_type:complete
MFSKFSVDAPSFDPWSTMPHKVSEQPLSTPYDSDFPPMLTKEEEKIRDLERKLDLKTSELHHARTCHREEKKELEEKISSLEHRNTFLEKKKDKYKEISFNYKKDLDAICEKKESLEKEMKNLQHQHALQKDTIKYLHSDIEILQERRNREHNKLVDEYSSRIANYERSTQDLRIVINNQDSLIRKANEKEREAKNETATWIGRSLKLHWIIKEMKKVGAIKLPEHDWAIDMVDEIEFPNSDESNPVPSVFMSVPNIIRERYLPSAEDAHMEWVDSEEEEEIYSDLSRQARDLSANINPKLSELLSTDPEKARSSITLIQSHIRGFLVRKRDPKLRQLINNPSMIKEAIEYIIHHVYPRREHIDPSISQYNTYYHPDYHSDYQSDDSDYDDETNEIEDLQRAITRSIISRERDERIREVNSLDLDISCLFE